MSRGNQSSQCRNPQSKNNRKVKNVFRFELEARHKVTNKKIYKSEKNVNRQAP